MATAGRGVPHAPAAERNLLGACLLSDDAAHLLARDVLPTDFYDPAHQRIAEAVIGLVRSGGPVDATTVATRLDERGQLASVGGHAGLIGLIADVATSTSAGAYADIVLERAARRRIIALGQNLVDAAYDMGDPVDPVVDGTVLSLRSVSYGGGDPVEVPSVTELLAGDGEEKFDWLVKDLLERQDRLILTGEEGQGKSTLFRQFAVQFAGGVHPFTLRPVEPLRVLVVDAENSQAQTVRQFRWLRGLLGPDTLERSFDGGRLRIHVESNGMNLLARGDRRRFTGLVRAARPDVIIAGPLYKLHDTDGKRDGEAQARDLASYLDEIRTTFDAALLLEAHAPHAQDGNRKRVLRPFGASLWLRWPEFGFGLRVTRTPEGTIGALEAWRGARDDNRLWPKRLWRTNVWPWEARRPAQAGQEAGRDDDEGF